MVSTYFPGVVSQVLGSEIGDLDDCWTRALDWAARASYPLAKSYTITEVRAAAGDPDDGISDGGSLDEGYKAARALWPYLAVTRFDGPWDTFMRLMKEGRTASLAVMSSGLPSALRFGYNGPHQVGVGWDNQFLVANPLAREGSAPLPCGEEWLKQAATASGLHYGGRVRAIIFPPQEASMTTVVTQTVFEKPRRFVVPAGVTLRGYDYDRPGRFIIERKFEMSSSASAVASVNVQHDVVPAPVPNGGPFLLVKDGIFAGLLIVASLVTLDSVAPPPDCSDEIAATAKLARAEGYKAGRAAVLRNASYTPETE